MTRINVIEPSLLTDQHLMAEYRELPMVHASLRRSKASKNGLPKIPEKYTLGSGHVKFFYDKGHFLRLRYQSLILELINRRYDIAPDKREVDWSVFDDGLNGDWTPDGLAVQENVSRIIQRVMAKPNWYRLNGVPINTSYLDNLMEYTDNQRGTLLNE